MKPLEYWTIITGIASLLSLFLSIISFFYPITIVTYSITGESIYQEINLAPLFFTLFFILFLVTIVLVIYR